MPAVMMSRFPLARRLCAGRVEVDLHLAAFDLLQPPHEIRRAQRVRRDHPPHEQAEVVGPDVFGTGQRAQVAHDAFVEYAARFGQVSSHGEVHATLDIESLRAGAIAAAAVTAMDGFGECFGDRAQRVPAIADVLDAIHVTFRFAEVIEEGNLHAVFDQCLAGQRGLHFLLAIAPDHYAAGAAYPLAHTADAFG